MANLSTPTKERKKNENGSSSHLYTSFYCIIQLSCVNGLYRKPYMRYNFEKDIPGICVFQTDISGMSNLSVIISDEKDCRWLIRMTKKPPKFKVDDIQPTTVSFKQYSMRFCHRRSKRVGSKELVSKSARSEAFKLVCNISILKIINLRISLLIYLSPKSKYLLTYGRLS